MLSERIKAILTETGLSKSEFARRTGVTPAAVWQIINRGKGVSAQFARVIELSLGYRAEWVLNGTGDKKVNPAAFERQKCIELVESLGDTELKLLARFIAQLKGHTDEEP